MYGASGSRILALELNPENGRTLMFLDDTGKTNELRWSEDEEKWIHSTLQSNDKYLQELVEWDRIQLSNQTVGIRDTVFNAKSGRKLFTIKNSQQMHTIHGSTNLLLTDTSDNGREMKFRVRPAPGSRKLNLLHIRTRIDESFFTSNRTVVIKSGGRHLHFNLNGTIID